MHRTAIYDVLGQVRRQRVSDGADTPLLTTAPRQLLLVWPQLGDFDSLEYAWWLRRGADELVAKGLTVRAVGIGDRNSGKAFCAYTGFPEDSLLLDSEGLLHQELSLYPGLTLSIPGFNRRQNAWLNLLLMCAGIGSPGTLSEVFRGYLGDRNAPQLIEDDEVVQATPLPPIKGEFFKRAGGKGFQRPFELATLRLRNMAEVLGNWQTYVPDVSHITQRGATYVVVNGEVVYGHCDRNILGFASNMSYPLSFLDELSLG
ncbi:peroxiredoxin-like family protein [Leptothoe sp. PORK10 BA2]|uniref:peroxiredoxin-like family protein n=1 Tax=Leptothoe sp. PORK10 BA2 TaxID=3110254 RepID=UPI002B2210F4|nr:peroxiredoxin-like family protein [Leptothoe sp. PORK10 BA2]MEA5465562.1 peroxiredoxin-like family protein [Leptothoe sp. PORK10 BA2]